MCMFVSLQYVLLCSVVRCPADLEVVSICCAGCPLPQSVVLNAGQPAFLSHNMISVNFSELPVPFPTYLKDKIKKISASGKYVC